jgi:CheY-like chemotaxis protein
MVSLAFNVLAQSPNGLVPDPSWARKKGLLSPMKSLTVMCVDDDAGIRELYGALLGQHGYQVIAATNGLHALHVFEAKEKEIDAVILDYEMPGMNGLELATCLKQRHPTLPVIMVSGSHPDLDQMAPFVDAAMGKGVPLRSILDRLQLLLAA